MDRPVSKRKRKRHIMVIEFGSKRFKVTQDTASKAGSDSYRFEIDPIYRVQGYAHPVRYRNSMAVQIMDWCAEHAANAHLHHLDGRSVLFKDEHTALMFKLTFSE